LGALFCGFDSVGNEIGDWAALKDLFVRNGGNRSSSLRGVLIGCGVVGGFRVGAAVGLWMSLTAVGGDALEMLCEVACLRAGVGVELCKALPPRGDENAAGVFGPAFAFVRGVSLPAAPVAL
jgi:hypothetical protein